MCFIKLFTRFYSTGYIKNAICLLFNVFFVVLDRIDNSIRSADHNKLIFYIVIYKMGLGLYQFDNIISGHIKQPALYCVHLLYSSFFGIKVIRVKSFQSSQNDIRINY